MAELQQQHMARHAAWVYRFMHLCSLGSPVNGGEGDRSLDPACHLQINTMLDRTHKHQTAAHALYLLHFADTYFAAFWSLLPH